MRGTRALLAMVLLVAIAVIASPGPSRGATAPGGETLTLEQECSAYPPRHTVRIILSAFPPNSEVVGTVEFPGGGGIGPVTVRTDADGGFTQTLDSTVPGTFRVTVEWSGGTLVETLNVNCGGPEGTLGVTPVDQVLEFGSKPIGFFSFPEQVTVTNHGPGALVFTGASLAGEDADEFLIASDSCSGMTLAVGAGCFVRVRFGPAAEGRRGATLELASSATARPYGLPPWGARAAPARPARARRSMARSPRPWCAPARKPASPSGPSAAQAGRSRGRWFASPASGSAAAPTAR